MSRAAIMKRANEALLAGMTAEERRDYFGRLARRSALVRRGDRVGADAIDLGRPIRHGLRSSYTKRGCRCQACRGAQASYQRDYMRRARSASGRTDGLG